MSNVRLIARLDIKGEHLIKGVRLEGLRKLGDPQEFAERYYQAGIDEIIYMDIVASLYERDSLKDLVRRTAENVFIPLTVGGGLRSVDDVYAMLRAGADKVAINTAAVKRPELIRDIAQRFGSQCMVLSVEAKRQAPSRWEVYTDNGRERSGLDVVQWVAQAIDLGAGEILLISGQFAVPVIASGGVGSVQHVIAGVAEGRADAIAMAHVLHYNKLSLADIRREVKDAGIEIRSI
jgi:cyclase